MLKLALTALEHDVFYFSQRRKGLRVNKRFKNYPVAHVEPYREKK